MLWTVLSFINTVHQHIVCCVKVQLLQCRTPRSNSQLITRVILQREYELEVSNVQEIKQQLAELQ